MKYAKHAVVPAVYTEVPDGSDNPFLQALPPMLDRVAVMSELASIPKVINTPDMPFQERLTYLTGLSTYYQPMDC